MGEKLGDEIENSNIKKIKNTKKEFIENWLVNSDFVDYEENNSNQYFETDFNFHQDKYSGSSNISSWIIDDVCGSKRKTKILKLQLKHLLKNFFNKNRSGKFSSYDISEEILTESNLDVLGNIRLKNNKINVCDDMEVRAADKNDHHLIKQNLETQLKKPFVRLDAPVASIRNTTKLDRCNRGHSEVIERCPRLHHSSSEHSSDDIEISAANANYSKWTNDQDSSKPAYVKIEKQEPSDAKGYYVSDAKFDKWELTYETKRIDRPNPEISDKSLQVQPSNPAFYPLNSYVKKLELIKNLFHTRLKKVERPKPKPSMTLVIKPTLPRTNSKSYSVEYSSVLTKDLTEASYLKEHERTQWQGKNRELWFRINAVYKNFNLEGRGKRNDKTTKHPQQLNVKNFNSDIEKIYYFTRGMTNRSESNLKQRDDSNRSNLSRYDSLFFDRSEAETHIKLEEIFVTDLVKNKRVKKCLTASRDSLKRYIRLKERNGVKRNIGSLRRETVRGEKEVSIPIVREHRCPSKISVTLSSSEWEDVSSQQSDASRSSSPCRFPRKLQKPLPNIPYTPSFRHHFHHKL